VSAVSLNRVPRPPCGNRRRSTKLPSRTPSTHHTLLSRSFRLTLCPLIRFPIESMLSRTVTSLGVPGKAGALAARRHISYSQVRQKNGNGGEVVSARGPVATAPAGVCPLDMATDSSLKPCEWPHRLTCSHLHLQHTHRTLE